MGELNTLEPKLREIGYQVILVSADKPEALKQIKRAYTPSYRLLSDKSMAGAKALGIAWKVNPNVMKKYQSKGINIEEASGMDHHILPVPASYVLNTEGKIEFSYINPNHRVRVDPDVLIAAAKAALKK